MSDTQTSRRTFIRRGSLTLLALSFVGGSATLRQLHDERRGGVTVYRRSAGRRRVSNAARNHNAHRLYRTVQAAREDAPHPGDRSIVVPITISVARFEHLFREGRARVDLRQVHDLAPRRRNRRRHPAKVTS